MTFQEIMERACSEWRKRLHGMTGRQAWAYLQSLCYTDSFYGEDRNGEVADAIAMVVHITRQGVCLCGDKQAFTAIFMPYEMICEAFGVEP